VIHCVRFGDPTMSDTALATSLKSRVRAWADPRFFHTGRWLLFSAMVGVVAGVGAIVFDQLFEFATHVLLGGIGGFVPPAAGNEQVTAPFGPIAAWRLPVVLVFGALISGVIVYRFAPETEGHGTDGVIKAFHSGLGKIRRRVPLIKMIASSVTIGAGGSAGREGPVAQIGAGFGSFLGDVFKLSNRERRLLMLAGVAGGIGAIFRAPLGAALFAGEVLYREPEFEYESLMPGLLSAIVGYSIYASYAGWDPMFVTAPAQFQHPSELLAYALLGVICAVAAVVYIKIFYGLRDRLFRPLPVPNAVKPAIGAALLGVVAVLGFPEVLGMGYGYVQQAIDGQLAVRWMLVFVVLKMLATSLTISSGGSGGVFAPSLAIGGVLGGAFGTVAHELVPGIVVDSSATFVLVGMGAFFAGAAKVPLASVVMVMEMTGSYGLLVPTLLAATISYLLVPLGVSLYENQVDNRVNSPAHLGSFAIDLLQGIKVADALEMLSRPICVREDEMVADVLKLVRDDRAIAYPVVDAEGALTGLLTFEEIRRALVLEQPLEEVMVREIARMEAEPVSPADDLRTVLQAYVENETRVIPVVESPGSRTVIGTISRGQVLLAYDRELRRRREHS